MLFNNYKNITYTVGYRDFEIADILTRISILSDYTTSNAFDEYYIQAGEMPEDVSYKMYRNEYFAWIVLLVNNIISEDEWYSGDETFLRILEKKYSGESYYITNLPKLEQGDIMVKVTSTSGNEVLTVDETKYRMVSEFNKDFRYIWGIGGSGTISAGDKIMFARKNAQNGTVEPLSFYDSTDPTVLTQFATIQYAEKKTATPIYFTNGSNNVVAPPNTVYSSGQLQAETIPVDVVLANTLSSESLNFARTLGYYYMTNNGQFDSNITKFTHYNFEFNKYEDRQKIRVLKPEYLSAVVDTIKQTLKSGKTGKRVVIGL